MTLTPGLHRGYGEEHPRDRDYYDVAQICPNGHVITPYADSHPGRRKAFCPECGEAT